MPSPPMIPMLWVTVLFLLLHFLTSCRERKTAHRSGRSRANAGRRRSLANDDDGAESVHPARGYSIRPTDPLPIYRAGAFGTDGCEAPAGPAPKARRMFSVTALAIGLNGEFGPGGVDLVIHQIDPEAKTPAPLGAV